MSFYERLREKRLVQIGIAYLGGAWFVMQLGDVLGDRWVVPLSILRAVDLLLLVGLPITIIVAWHHGATGRQRVTGVEIVAIGLCLLAGGLALPVAMPHPAAVPVVAVLAVDLVGVDREAISQLQGLQDEMTHLLSLEESLEVSAIDLASMAALHHMLRAMGEEKGPDFVVQIRAIEKEPGSAIVYLTASHFGSHRILSSTRVSVSGPLSSRDHVALSDALFELVLRIAAATRRGQAP